MVTGVIKENYNTTISSQIKIFVVTFTKLPCNKAFMRLGKLDRHKNFYFLVYPSKIRDPNHVSQSLDLFPSIKTWT